MKSKFFSSLGVSFLILWVVTWNWNTPIPVYFFRLPGLEQHSPHLILTFYGLVIWTAVIVGVPFAVFNIVNRRHYQDQSKRAKKKADRLLEENVKLQEQIDLLRSAGLSEPESESAKYSADLDDPLDEGSEEAAEDWQDSIKEETGEDLPLEEVQSGEDGFGGMMDMIRGRKLKESEEESE
jgi:hypothetical protein